MAGTEADFASAELELVKDDVPALFDRDGTFYSEIELVDSDPVSARDTRAPLELTPGGQFGYFDPDNGSMGSGDGAVIIHATIPVASTKHVVQWSKKAEWATDSVRKSRVDAFRHNLAKAMTEFRRHSNNQCMTAGDGTLATVSAVSTAGGVDTITLDADGFGAKSYR